MGTTHYLAILKAREPYIFSTDQKSLFINGNEKGTGKESYFLKSNVMPEQTTIWGMMRLLLLEQAGNLMKPDFGYTEEELEKIEEIIGKESFSFYKENQKFGQLKGISPVFLLKEIKTEGNDGDKDKVDYQYVVSNPFCNTTPSGKKGFNPYEMTPSDNFADTKADSKLISLPIGYDPKEGFVGGFVNVSTKEVISNDSIFKRVVHTNSRKNRDGKLAVKDKNTGGFFRRERFVMDDAYSFAFFVDIDDGIVKELKDDFVTIGAGKNVFSIRFIKDKEESELEEKIKTFINCEDSNWHYAWSDIVFKGTPQYKDFSIVQFRYLRNLTTNYKQKFNNEQFKRSDDQIKLIQRGSAFYKDSYYFEDLKQEPDKNSNAYHLGYNRIL